ncbi:hypothetical protein [Litoribrevibacter albus]|uniref:Uncharacterized protein n=1 Tax=Litoribrevibacter albus TaxID=1473156 RepID=A0AA37S8S4_9GAMM|nr:hypothetical protein [Litoribrevibacter albus]GLQ31342.1 hypothetical protein GCM10007876_18210 [Litoribrevibacter albus]
MEYVLIVAAVYNLIGAFTMWFQPVPESTSDASMPFDYMQYRIFTGGTAFVFALIYLYVFYVPASAVPLLVFGIALKLWSFIASLISFKKYSFPKEEFLKVGVGNLVFAILFVLYLVTSTDIISQ